MKYELNEIHLSCRLRMTMTFLDLDVIYLGDK